MKKTRKWLKLVGKTAVLPSLYEDIGWGVSSVEFILKFKSNKAGLEAHTIGTFVHHDNDDRIILYMARKSPFFNLPFAINFFDYDEFKNGRLEFIKNQYNENEKKTMNRFLKNLSWAKIPDKWQ